MDINPEVKTSYTTQYQEALLNYMENEYCAKHQRVQDNIHESVLSNYLVHPVPASGSGQSSLDPYDLSSNDEEYLMPNNVAGTTPRRRDRAARLLTASWLCVNSPHESPENRGQINRNFNDYHS